MTGGSHVQGFQCPAGRQTCGSGSRLRRSPSKWGNPFVLGRDGSRDDVIAKYRAWIVRQPALMAALHELHGKDLVWCSPERCHAEVLVELANA
jgi:Domain of unknown function (DUF4326)